MSHLTELDRQRIEYGLRQGMSYQRLALELGKSRTTIAREVLKHHQPSEKGASRRISNRCLYRRNCNVWLQYS